MFDESLPQQYDSINEFLQNYQPTAQMVPTNSPQSTVSLPQTTQTQTDGIQQPGSQVSPSIMQFLNRAMLQQTAAQQAQKPPEKGEGETYGSMGGGLVGKAIGSIWGPIGGMIGGQIGKSVGGKIGMMVDDAGKNWPRLFNPME